MCLVIGSGETKKSQNHTRFSLNEKLQPCWRASSSICKTLVLIWEMFRLISKKSGLRRRVYNFVLQVSNLI